MVLPPQKPFTDLTQARAWVHEFVTCYNTQHRHSGIQFVTPQARHSEQDHQILWERTRVYEAAKQAKPERWKGRKTRNWEPVTEVYLNPSDEQLAQFEKMSLAS